MDFSSRMMKFISLTVFISLMISVNQQLYCQVKHNYPVGPQNTSCDSLDVSGMTRVEAIKQVENAVFRFNQNFKLSRTSGVRAAHYYSCDGSKGYLVITVNKDKLLFLNVPKNVWNEIITSSDIDGFYEESIRGKFRQPGG